MNSGYKENQFCMRFNVIQKLFINSMEVKSMMKFTFYNKVNFS